MVSTRAKPAQQRHDGKTLAQRKTFEERGQAAHALPVGSTLRHPRATAGDPPSLRLRQVGPPRAESGPRLEADRLAKVGRHRQTPSGLGQNPVASRKFEFVRMSTALVPAAGGVDRMWRKLLASCLVSAGPHRASSSGRR